MPRYGYANALAATAILPGGLGSPWYSVQTRARSTPVQSERAPHTRAVSRGRSAPAAAAAAAAAAPARGPSAALRLVLLIQLLTH